MVYLLCLALRHSRSPIVAEIGLRAAINLTGSIVALHTRALPIGAVKPC